MSVNKVILLGRTGKDVELKNLSNGNKVANFSMATSETYKDKTGEKKESTEWHNIVLWGNTAEIAHKYLKKGDRVYIEGSLKTRSWEKDGITRYTTEVWGSSIVLLGEKRSEGGTQSNAQQMASVQPDDSLPF